MCVAIMCVFRLQGLPLLVGCACGPGLRPLYTAWWLPYARTVGRWQWLDGARCRGELGRVQLSYGAHGQGRSVVAMLL